MEEKIIDKLRKQKKILKRVKKYVKGYIDLESEIMDSETIYILSLILKLEEEITDIIYILMESRNH